MADMEVDQAERLSALAARLKASGSLGRSDLMNRLFDFLLTQSLAGRSPKEFEVAQEVFGKDTEFDMAQDASVRVYIHRLRKKLDEVYAQARDERLTIPRGEYRLAVETPLAIDADIAPVDILEEDGPSFPSPKGWRGLLGRATIIALCLAFAVGILVGASAWMLRDRSTGTNALAKTGLWSALVSSDRPTMVVVGDYYIFGEAPDGLQVTRLVREFSINSRDDLDQYLMEYPAAMGRYVDMDLHYLPISTAPALREVLPFADAFTAGAGLGRPRVITMSRLTPEFLKRGNVIYVGFLSSLGLLRDPVFKASGFAVGSSYDELIDRKSGKHYVSDVDSVGSRSPRRDYAYLASFPGPSGNRIIVISGTRDAAVMQAAEVAADKAQLEQIAKRAGDAPAFEALYEVWTLGTLNTGSNLLLARSLKVDGLWQSRSEPETFPDQLPTPAPSMAPFPGAPHPHQ
jgi:hypothetical protein